MNLQYQIVKDFIIKNYKWIIIGILVIVILFQSNCSRRQIAATTIETKIDTVYTKITDTIIKDVKVKTVEYVYVKGPKYEPSDNIDTCKSRFNTLFKEFSKKTTYTDKINVMINDSTKAGSITIIDTVWQNKLYGKRIYLQDYKIPVITKTITVTNTLEPLAKRQLYVGATAFGQKEGFKSISPGILYKTKKDQIYNLGVNIDFTGNINYGAGMYFKL